MRYSIGKTLTQIRNRNKKNETNEIKSEGDKKEKWKENNNDIEMYLIFL